MIRMLWCKTLAQTFGLWTLGLFLASWKRRCYVGYALKPTLPETNVAMNDSSNRAACGESSLDMMWTNTGYILRRFWPSWNAYTTLLKARQHHAPIGRRTKNILFIRRSQNNAGFAWILIAFKRSLWNLKGLKDEVTHCFRDNVWQFCKDSRQLTACGWLSRTRSQERFSMLHNWYRCEVATLHWPYHWNRFTCWRL